MNCHQILSGACNAGDHCFAVGSVEGVPFTAYAAGCNIVILASSFERVQIIPGAWHNYIRISCLDCSTDTGKIAASYENQVCIFEPTPLIHNSSSHHLDYRWVQTGSLQTDSHISSLSWNLEGTRLLTGGEILQLWRQHPTTHDGEYDPESMPGGGGVTFEIGEDSTTTAEEEDEPGWVCVWRCHTATPVVYMAFSADGTLFATAGRSDRLVKIWYENKQLLFPSKSLDQSMSFGGQSTLNEVNYGFVYIAHPRAVTHLSWRKTSKYMPKGAVSNMLVTSCRDNICRVWVETVLPEDGLVNMTQFDPRATQNPKFRTHRHKHRFLQRLRHMKACFHIRRHAKSQQPPGSGLGGLAAPIPTLPSTYSVHDFHSYGYHGTGLTPGLHFHLAASINAETDIPLVPSLVTGDPDLEPNFVLHWLNNKEMHFSLQAESMLHEMTRRQVEREEASAAASGTDGSGREPQEGSQNDTDPDEHSPRKKMGRVAKAASQDESSEEQHGSAHSSGHSHPSLSATTSINSLATDTGAAGAGAGLADPLDAAIECLLRDWHHSPDLLFAIHPIDGSFLVWVAEWLDEYHPGLFRQAQVSFASRLPSTFPLGDAMTMSTNICLYNAYGCHLGDRDHTSAPLGTARGTSPPAPPSPGGVGLEDVASSTALLPSVQEEVEGADGPQLTTPSAPAATSPATEAAPAAGHGMQKSGGSVSADPSPTVSMVTKHSNGTLNLWQLTFADKTKFSQVLTIGHACRASGHRFRVNDITCHPVLPLLLTTSHHNISDVPAGSPFNSRAPLSPMGRGKDVSVPTGFCSELILWRVDAVGPLSRSGGVSELARINSPEISAFSNVAWIPTLLPSTTLGNLSNSPSACFVASDGQSLRVYQAVIDARTLLAEVNSSERRSRMLDSLVSLSTDTSSEDGIKHTSLHDHIRIVSQQSTARPGCVIQLDAITDATHDWQNTQFLHVFQEQLITGERNEDRILSAAVAAAGGGDGGTGGVSGGTGDAVNTMGAGDLGLMHSELGAMVDLQQSSVFEEPFYIVVLEKAGSESVLHMWRLVIASQPDSNELSGSMMYVPDSQLVQDEEEPELAGGRSASMAGVEHEGAGAQHQTQTSHVVISTTKVCTQALPLPDGVELVHAAPAAGHLSSASIYPACFAPYIIVTACSDSTIRFWKCKISGGDPPRRTYEWCEWEMSRKGHTSAIEITGQPLNISAAYSGRIACAYKYGKSFTRPSKNDPDSRYVNLCVAIYECESTGGSEWVLEDTIHLKNIHLPRMQLHPQLDLSVLQERPRRFGDERGGRRNGADDMHSSLHKSGTSLTAVPSFSTLQSLRRSIIECGNTCPLTQKHLVQLDWVSKEDGSHILTVAVGSKVLLFTPVSSDLAQANMKAMKESQSTNRPILRKASSLAVPQFVDEIRWMKLRKIDLMTADGLPPLPMQLSWVRDGILVVGMDSEMHVYSQWKPSVNVEQVRGALAPQESEELPDSRNLRDEDLRSLVQETSQRRMATVSSMPHLSRVSSINLTMLDSKKKRGAIVQAEAPSVDYMPDYGLFEASRIACPVLPQYHPKQLMELLNSGKIRWVKAILAHLVRCISGTCAVRQGTLVQGGTDEENLVRQRGWSRSRTLSVSYVGAGTNSPLEQRGSTTAIPEEVTLDYAEINSIPPLPLWTLLAADREPAGAAAQSSEETQDYNDLFDGNVADADESLDDLLVDEPESPRRHDRRVSMSQERQGLSHFGPRQGRVLSRLLTHTHLPGLSSLDQMHLLALADTVSTCNSDFAERFAIDAAKTAIAKENLSGMPEGEDISTDSLDDCGLRYLLAMKHYSYLLRCLPLAQRAHFQRQGVGTNNLVWAFHSESEEELLALIPSYAKGSPKWAQLKELGVGWWLRSHTLLKTCIEKIAKASYMVRQDPLDAAIFYLAMKKKSLVWGLFRSKRDERMTSFFSNNFSEDRWRKAALKNAFALLGKQRFEHAAAFFLLAGALRDAIEVCLNKLEDFQLAMILARLHEGERDPTPPSLQRLLWEEILGCDPDGSNPQQDRAHPDPFLRSMALWILKDYSGSLNTLLQTNVGCGHPQYNDEDKPESASANPNVFNFYVYLRTHPLLVRQYIATSAQGRRTGPSLVLAGFSYGSDARASDKQLMLEDSITPLERQLYFTTAHAHFKAGCPALALEVLSKLPCKVLDSSGSGSPSTINSPSKGRTQNPEIDSGIIQWGTLEITTTTTTTTADSSAFDWSAPVTRVEEELVLDWANGNEEDPDTEDSSDQGLSMKPVRSDSDAEGSGASGQLDIMAQQLKFVACLKILMEELSTLATGFEVDGGQLRYQLYVWLEREVDALRHLCNYSSGEPEGAGGTSVMEESVIAEPDHCGTPILRQNEKPTLHEILMVEKMDFEAKVQRASRRKKWLKANEALLRTLLSYCSLHGASGGGLAAVRMELVLLLQELQQEKSQQQLLSPLPFPTTLPLLSASVACHKTVVADPVRHLQAQTHDMLATIMELRSPPAPSRMLYHSEVFVLRDLAVALSACIYQSLCDSDTFSVKQQPPDSFPPSALEALARLNTVHSSSHLIAGQPPRRRRYSSDEPLQVTTHPSKWPGVTNLRALLAREKDEDTPRLNILLVEAFVATYMSLVVYAMSTCDSLILYRLAGQRFTPQTWATLYGGGVKKLLRVAASNPTPQTPQTPQSAGPGSLEREGSASEGSGVWTAVTSLTKQRYRLNMRLLGQFGSQGGAPHMKEDKPTYREQFVPPEMSMISYFLIKPQLSAEAAVVDYDSAESAESEPEDEEEEEDVFEGTGGVGGTSRLGATREPSTEHSNPNSFSWCVLRLALVRVVQRQLHEFLNAAGIELPELPVLSPLVHGVLRTVAQWQDLLAEELDQRRPPPADYIPGCYVEPTTTGPAIHKYRSLLEASNTPFHGRHASAAPARRLWRYLVRQELVQEIFIRAVFGKRRSVVSLSEPLCVTDSTRGPSEEGGDSGTAHPSLPEPVKIIHKDQDSISAFCLNQQAGSGLMALATPREVQEMDISLLLESPSWLEDECEFDVVNLTRDPDTLPASSFLVIQTSADRSLVQQTLPPGAGSAGLNTPASPQPGLGGQTGRGASVMKGLSFPGCHDPRFCQFVIERSRHLLKPVQKHRVDGIRRVCSHPFMAMYLTGAQDGSVQMWEWNATQPVAVPRPPGTFAKVTRVRFSEHGNKFGVGDGDGNVSLWQASFGSNSSAPFFTYQCHNKLTSDFVFLGSCSLIATAGHSSESRNLAIWDSLLPQKKALVQAFPCHDQGAAALVYAPQHQLLISAGKRGDVCIVDLRQRLMRHRFQAHDSAIKCLALDPAEEFFVTGSADGDIKVWALAVHGALYSFPGEHARSSFFKNIGQGVTQLHVDGAHRMFSCGADGSMKVRQLPDRESAVHTLY